MDDLTNVRERITTLEAKQEAGEQALHVANKVMDAWKETHNNWIHQMDKVIEGRMDIKDGKELERRIRLLEEINISRGGGKTAAIDIRVAVVGIIYLLILAGNLIVSIITYLK